MKRVLKFITVVLIIVAAVALFHWWQRPKSGEVKDEALLAGVNADYFKAADVDYFHDMDGGVKLTTDEILAMIILGKKPGDVSEHEPESLRTT